VRVAVTGARGLLGRTLVPLWRAAGVDVLAWAHADVDVTDRAAVAAAVATARPDVIVHLAAWTDVDGAEGAPDRAIAVNRDGTAAVAAAAAQRGAVLAHVSTDYVLDGSAGRPLPPDGRLAPLGAYARSKAEAEAAVRMAGPWLVVRAGWLYGPGGPNFVDAMRERAAARQPVRVVDDQRGAPTPVRIVAEALYGLVAGGARGVWHVAAAGEATWWAVARAVFEACGTDPALVAACTSAELGRPAPRPAYAVLDCSATAARLGVPFPRWDDAVTAYARGGTQAGLGLIRAAA